jgi:hypothetical protein
MRTLRSSLITPGTNEVMGAGTYGMSFDQTQTLNHYGAWYYLDLSGGPSTVRLSIWDPAGTVVATTGVVSTSGHTTAAWNFVPFTATVSLPYGTGYLLAITTTATSTIHRTEGVFGTFTEAGQNIVGTQGVDNLDAPAAYPTVPTNISSRLYAIDFAFAAPVDPDRWLHDVESAFTVDPTSEDTNGGVATNVGLAFKVTDWGALLGFRYFCPSFGTGMVKFRLVRRGVSADGSFDYWSTEHYSWAVPGWNDLTFDGSVIMLDPATCYVATVLSAQGYAYTPHALTSAINRGSIHVPADVELVSSDGGAGVATVNGRFSTTTGVWAYPNSSFNETQYGVDILFVPGVRMLYEGHEPVTQSANDGVDYTLGTKITPNVPGRIHGTHIYVPDDGGAVGVTVDTCIWDVASYSSGDHASPYRTQIPPYNMYQARRIGQLFPNHDFLYRDTDTSSEIMTGLYTRNYVATSHFFDAPVSNTDASLTGGINAGQFADSVAQLTFPSSSFGNGGYWVDMLYELIPAEPPADTGESSRFMAFFG